MLYLCENEKREVDIVSFMSKFPIGKMAFFATGNVHKFCEARLLLSEFKIAAAMLRVKPVEIQDSSIENIAVASALDVVRKCHLPIIVEDAGLFIRALNNFPGPYSSYVFQTIGTSGILKLMNDIDNRNAYFHSVVAFCKPREKPVTFHGKVEGKIVQEERDGSGFGFDPIIAPLKGDGRTFAEMAIEEKNRFSHRAEAFRKFAKWYISQ
jgi:XTP/dITP diphosphohydrolase